jgi:hypothetical protein
MFDKVTVFYVVEYSVFTTEFEPHILSEVTDLGDFEFPKQGEVYLVQMIDGQFGRGLFLVRSVTDDRIMRNLRAETDPKVTYKSAPARHFRHLRT